MLLLTAYITMPSLSGSGGRSSHVNFASSYWFGRMYSYLQATPNARRGAAILALTSFLCY